MSGSRVRWRARRLTIESEYVLPRRFLGPPVASTRFWIPGRKRSERAVAGGPLRRLQGANARTHHRGALRSPGVRTPIGSPWLGCAGVPPWRKRLGLTFCAAVRKSSGASAFGHPFREAVGTSLGASASVRTGPQRKRLGPGQPRRKRLGFRSAGDPLPGGRSLSFVGPVRTCWPRRKRLGQSGSRPGFEVEARTPRRSSVARRPFLGRDASALSFVRPPVLRTSSGARTLRSRPGARMLRGLPGRKHLGSPRRPHPDSQGTRPRARGADPPVGPWAPALRLHPQSREAPVREPGPLYDIRATRARPPSWLRPNPERLRFLPARRRPAARPLDPKALRIVHRGLPSFSRTLDREAWGPACATASRSPPETDREVRGDPPLFSTGESAPGDGSESDSLRLRRNRGFTPRPPASGRFHRRLPPDGSGNFRNSFGFEPA